MRNRRYNYEPQVVDPGVIDFGAIQMYNPEDTARLAQVGQNMQQRWDASQSVIAKQLEDIGAANINSRYKADVIGRLEGDIENIYKDVNTTYQGDFGRAYTDILKSIGKSRSLLHSATQATAEETKQRDIYNQMAAAGKAPVIYKRDDLGRPTPKVMTFEEYHGIDRQPSFVEGKFVGPSFSTLRSAGEYEPYIERMVGHLMKQSTEEGLSRDPKYAAFLRQVKTIGQDPVALRKLFDTDQPEAQAMVEDFVRNNPTVTQEFVDESGKLDMNLAKDFLADALVTRVKESTDYNYMQNPGYNPKPNLPGPLTPGSRGKYTYTGRVTDEVSGSRFINFVRSIIGGGKDEESLKEFIARRGHETSPLDPIQINGKTFSSPAKALLDYWTDLENESREIPEGFTPEMMTVVDEFLKTDKKGRYVPNRKLVAGEVRTKLEHAFLAEQKRLTGLWEQLKADYNDIYKIVQSRGGTDSDFIEAAEFVKRRDDKVKYSLASWADVEEGTYTGESIIAKIPEETELSRVGSRKKDKKGSVKLKPETVKVNLYHGVIRAQNNKGNINEITSKDLPDNVAQFMDQAKLILQKATKYGKESSPDVLPYQEPIPGYSISAYPVIIYEFDENTLSNKMRKIYVQNPHGKIFNKDGSLSDNVYLNSDKSLIQYYYDTTDLSDYMMDKLSIVFNPYAKKQ